MKQEQIAEVRELVTIFLNHLLFVAVSITAIDLFDIDNTYLLLWIAFIIVPVFFHYLRIKTRKILFFYGLHLLVILGVMVIPAEPLIKGLMIFIILFYTVWYVRIKMFSETGKEILLPAPFVVVCFGILEIIENLKNGNQRGSYYLAIVLIYLVGYFAYYFLKQYIDFVEMNEKCAANIPKRDIFWGGMKKTGIFCIGSVFILILTANLNWLSKIMAVIWNWILSILRKYISGMEPPTNEEISTELLPNQNVEIGDTIIEEPLMPEYLRDLIEKIALIVAFVFVVVVICVLIFEIYKLIREHFLNYKKKEALQIKDTNEDIRENCGIEGHKKKASSLLGFLNTRERIRKIYRKRVLKDKKKLIGDRSENQLSYLTAKECCDKLSEQNLKAVYEKARYSEEKVTAEDLRSIK